MKRVLRRTVSVLCALALTASCLTASMFVSAASNLAAGSTVFIDAVHASWGDKPSTMVDGQYNTRWQSGNSVENATSYLGIAWESAQTFNTIVVHWEASYPNESTKIYIAQSAAALAVIDQTRWTDETCYSEGTTVWTEVTPTLARVDGANGVTKADTWTFDDAVTAYAIKVESQAAGNGSNYNMSAFEIEVFDYSAGTPYDVSGLNKAVDYVNKAFGTSNTYGYSDASWAAFDAARTAATTAATALNGQIVGTVDGYATQEDVDAVATALYAAAAKLTGNGSATTNLLENGIMIYNTTDMQSYASGNNYRTLTDGLKANDANNWQPNSWSTPVYLKVNNAATMNEIVIFAESTAEEYGIEYTTADVTNVTDVAGMEALSWTNTGATREYAIDCGNGTAYQFYTFDDAANVTAIKLTCTTANMGAWCKLREVEAYYDVEGANTTTTNATTFSSTDGTQKFVAVVVDEKDTAGSTLTAEYTITTANGSVTDTVTISTSYAAVSLGGTLITAGDLNGAHNGDYVTGVLFTNLNPEVEYDIQVEFELN